MHDLKIYKLFMFNEARSISSEFLNDIYAFSGENRDSSIENIELHTIKGDDDMNDVITKSDLHRIRFSLIGFKSFVPEASNASFGSQFIVITKQS